MGNSHSKYILIQYSAVSEILYANGALPYNLKIWIENTNKYRSKTVKKYGHKIAEIINYNGQSIYRFCYNFPNGNFNYFMNKLVGFE